MVEWTPKQRVVLKANPDWKGTPVAFPEVQFINIEDTKAAELAFEAGEVDDHRRAAGNRGTLSESRCRRAPSSPSVPGPYFTWIGLNTQHEKLKDIRVRKAIQRAIDVKSILDAAYGGVASVAHGVVTDGVTGHRTTSKYSYNPDEARALLAGSRCQRSVA